MRKKAFQYSVFCAHEQAMTPHNHLPDQNNEVLLQCASCGRILKFPVGLGQDEFVAAIKKHKKDNKVKDYAAAVEPAPLASLPLPTVEEVAESGGIEIVPVVVPEPVKEKKWWQRLLS
jgi:hypothetical protein